MRQILRGGAVVSGGIVAEYAAQVLRVLLLARMLGGEEFGITVSLNAFFALVEMGTFIGVDRFLILAPDGDSPRLLATANVLSLAKGLITAAVMLLLAWPTAYLLSIPNAAGSFCALAVVPLLRGFAHLRVQQIQRTHVFWPDAVSTGAGGLVGLLVCFAAALALRDHRALVWGLCAQAALGTLLTHVLARTRYRLAADWADLRRALRFGVPLMLNGLALALFGQLDRLVVGGLLGLIAVGRYGLAMTVVLVPSSLLFRVGMSVTQPHLSAAWRGPGPARFRALFAGLSSGFALLGALLGIGVTVLGDSTLRWAFGPRYVVGDVFMALLGAGALLRFAKGMANLGGLAIGRTVDLMLSNAAGALGLLVTVGALLVRPTLEAAALGYLSGEVFATLVIVILLDRFLRGQGGSSPYRQFVLAAPVQAAAITWVLLFDPAWPARVAVVAASVLIAAWIGRSFVLSPLEPALPRQA